MDDRVSIPGRDKDTFSSLPRPGRLWCPPSVLSNGYDQGLFLSGKSGWGVKLTNHLHLVPRWRICGAIPPLLIRFHGVVPY